MGSKLNNQWYMHRFTAILLVPLGLWFAMFFADFVRWGATLQNFRDALSCTFCAYALSAFIVVMAYHVYLLIYEVIEDYVQRKSCQKLGLFLLTLVSLSCAVVGVAAVFKLRGAF